MKRLLTVLAYGVAGLVVALALTLGAFALAGQEIAEPAGPPVFTTSPSESPGAVRSPADDETRSPDASRSESPSPSPDDRDEDSRSGPNSGSGSGSDEDDRDDDSSGRGSGSDDDDHDDD